MTELRTKITRGWRPVGAPARRVDDFAESAQATLATRAPVAGPAPARQVERRSIGRRLENWGMWANMGSHGSGGGADCMTGLICANMRRHSVGELHPPAPINDRIDVPDAERINAGLARIDAAHRGVLQWTYVMCSKPWAVAGACGFPSSEYGERLAAAQVAIESAVATITGRCA